MKHMAQKFGTKKKKEKQQVKTKQQHSDTQRQEDVHLLVLDMLSWRKVPRSLDQEETGTIGNVKVTYAKW